MKRQRHEPWFDRPSIAKGGRLYAVDVDSRSIVEKLMTALPEAFDAIEDREHYLGKEPLPYAALGDARMWLEDHALDISIVPRRATVRPEYDDAFRRFWNFVEHEAQTGQGDADLETLLQIECCEGVGWVEDVLDYVGPATRELLVDAQHRLAGDSSQVGRWTARRRRRSQRPPACD